MSPTALALALIAMTALAAALAMGARVQPGEYTSTVQLDPLYTLHFSVDHATMNVSLAVEVRTNSWFGFGLSPDGRMLHSDVVMGGVFDGQVFFEDRHTGDSHSTPVPDTHSNWFLTSGESIGAYYVFRFWRLASSCDQANDRDMGLSASHVIWSFADPVPGMGAASIAVLDMPHTHAGSRPVSFLTGPSEAPVQGDPSLIETTLALADVPVPANVSSAYLCQGFKLFGGVVQHVIRYEPRLRSPNVRHIIAYACAVPPDANATQAFLASAGDCDRDLALSPLVTQCRRTGAPIMAWFEGDDAFSFPSTVGLPVGGVGYSFVVLEVRLDNPAGDAFEDDSGLRLSVTRTRRAADAGALWLGLDSEGAALSGPPPGEPASFVLPPGQARVTLSAYARRACMSAALRTPVTVFAAIAATRLAGVAVELTSARAGVEQPPLLRNDAYDARKNAFSYVHPPRVVESGDVLAARCTYDTRGRAAALYGGRGVGDESCRVAVFYWPRQAVASMLAQQATAAAVPAFVAALLAGESAAQYNATQLQLAASAYAVDPGRAPGDDALASAEAARLQRFFVAAGVAWRSAELAAWDVARSLTPDAGFCLYADGLPVVPAGPIGAAETDLITLLPPPPVPPPCPNVTQPAPASPGGRGNLPVPRDAIIAGLIVSFTLVAAMLAGTLVLLCRDGDAAAAYIAAFAAFGTVDSAPKPAPKAPAPAAPAPAAK